MGGNITLGGNLSVTAGPIGAGAEGSIAADIDNRKFASMFSYTRSKGLFAGKSLVTEIGNTFYSIQSYVQNT